VADIGGGVVVVAVVVVDVVVVVSVVVVTGGPVSASVVKVLSGETAVSAAATEVAR
jgi:hypothetical protein